MASKARELHVGRSWPGMKPELEEACPCPKARCGLVAHPAPDCPQHGPLAMKTMRQMHYADECPARPALARAIGRLKDAVRARRERRRHRRAMRWRFDWHHPKASLQMGLGFGPDADGQAQWEIVSRVRWAASHYLCIGQWFWDGKDDCHKCGSQPSDIDFLMKRIGFRKAECIDSGECQQLAEENGIYEDEEEADADHRQPGRAAA